MYRGDMAAYFAEHIPGFDPGGLVRSYGNRFYYKPIIKDELKCIRCALCAERCPTGAITMEALEIDESPQTALGLYHETMSRGRI